MKTGTKVRAKTSAQENKVGTIVGINNTALPIAVDFGNGIEWDFKSEELEEVQE